ncbi:flagellar hook-associated protein 2 [Sediminibacillus albus]|uniref:flagellar hook-associated protein 2 n=1 Tax=Sediminibacillus albus TaxID=407036 RepID=UPI0031839159
MNSVNSMRIGGLASGMDIDQIVSDLMEAERIPLNKMEQDKAWMTWQRDAFRDVSKSLSELDDLVRDMRLQKTYSTKETSSSQSGVTATASASASSGTYTMEVTQLATAAINVSSTGISADSTAKIDPLGKLSEQNFAGGVTVPDTLEFTTYHNGEETHQIAIEAGDTLSSVLTKVTDQDNGVRAFYDVQTDKVVLERTEAGDYNPGGEEIVFNGNSGFFTDTLQLTQAGEQNGTDATFIYNGAVELTSKTNSTTLNGVTFNFLEETTGAAQVTVSNDVDASVDKIMAFVDKYNEVIEKVNGSLNEPRYRDYKPLTEAQKKDMSEKEIELWEEKAKSGLLKGESMLSSGLFDMRQGLYAQVDNGSQFSHLSEIGIKTSSNYLDAGKLIVNEDKLRDALKEDSDSVYQLFSNDTEGAGRGIMHRMDDAINSTMRSIEERAGRGLQTLEQYTLGKRLKDVDNQIDRFQDKLTQIEDRYWRQFTAMEKAIQRMNEQSSYLMQQFNG